MSAIKVYPASALSGASVGKIRMLDCLDWIFVDLDRSLWLRQLSNESRAVGLRMEETHPQYNLQFFVNGSLQSNHYLFSKPELRRVILLKLYSLTLPITYGPESINCKV